MAKQNSKKLNWLEQNLPEGLLVSASWMEGHGYSSSLRSQYVSAGWLEQPARGVFRRARGSLRWEQVVISLQTLLEFPVVVGGRTALELQGYAHFLAQEQKEVHLYSNQAAPSWLSKLPLKVRFVLHKASRLFASDPPTRGLAGLEWKLKERRRAVDDPFSGDVVVQSWGQWDWPLVLSTPERAILELLDELPERESFHQADKLMEGLVNLSPRRLQKLLEECKSIKVKRLFFFFAERHAHSWFKRIERSHINLGEGNRMLVRGGKLDKTYGITVPGDLDALQ